MTLKGTAIMHAHRYNYHYRITVDEIRQDYLRANGPPELRHVREPRPHRIIAVSIHLRAFISGMLVAAGEYIRRERVAEPADTA